MMTRFHWFLSRVNYTTRELLKDVYFEEKVNITPYFRETGRANVKEASCGPEETCCGPKHLRTAKMKKIIELYNLRMAKGLPINTGRRRKSRSREHTHTHTHEHDPNQPHECPEHGEHHIHNEHASAQEEPERKRGVLNGGDDNYHPPQPKRELLNQSFDEYIYIYIHIYIYIYNIDIRARHLLIEINTLREHSRGEARPGQAFTTPSSSTLDSSEHNNWEHHPKEGIGSRVSESRE